MSVVMDGVREYGEKYPVEIDTDRDTGRVIIVASNEANYNCTRVDLLDVIEWIEKNREAVESLKAAAAFNASLAA